MSALPLGSPSSLLTRLAGDEEQAEIFAGDGAIQSWVAAERALALAQAEHGVLSRDGRGDSVHRFSVLGDGVGVSPAHRS